MYSTKLAGLELEDPFLIASGIVPDVPEFMESICKQYRPSAITTKTFTLNPLNPHHSPTFIKIGEGCYMNAIGLGNPGIGELREVGCRLFVSIGGSSKEEIIETAIRAENLASLIEINVSSPNRRNYGADVSSSVREIVKDVKSVVSKPVFVKLGPWDNVVELSGKALDGGADGLTLINTIKGMKIDVETGKPILSYGTGGISGRCIHPIAVRIIHDVYREYAPEIIGVGGVFSADDALELMEVGAKAIGLGTVLIDQGYQSLTSIREQVKSFLEEKGINLSSVIGSGVKK
ncbi:dihydroorotate dehydrogenase PyrD [Metallosphaera hakonensis]|uniref:Dihydroorotate dehydrogenase n=1 Tax=Metallosphaera hakonensis JCM 8857 = DSM 7519 TaxID=1293036 RepID=A0A2U9IUP0_9CREN|nr:dihydroorotate dehydrogenase PyrD [Metallosphaera hakonensis]AWR99756.1 dihydroorotate dehydrogenase [Metallosphaera hakonensis JCM 8857 = DSM 7519]